SLADENEFPAAIKYRRQLVLGRLGRRKVRPSRAIGRNIEPATVVGCYKIAACPRYAAEAQAHWRHIGKRAAGIEVNLACRHEQDACRGRDDALPEIPGAAVRDGADFRDRAALDVLIR